VAPHHAAPVIGFVPQDTLLVPAKRSAATSLSALPEYDEQRVRKQQNCQPARRRQDSARLTRPWVGERGINSLWRTKSSGPRLRRAVVRDPRILILDDSLSAVDTQNREPFSPDCAESWKAVRRF